jgi:hypothetical protein
MKKLKNTKRNSELFFGKIGISLGVSCFLMAYLTFHKKPEIITMIPVVFVVLGIIVFVIGIDFFMKGIN